MATAVLGFLAALIPLVLTVLTHYEQAQAQKTTPEGQDEAIDKAMAGSMEDVGALLHSLHDHAQRVRDAGPQR